MYNNFWFVGEWTSMMICFSFGPFNGLLLSPDLQKCITITGQMGKKLLLLTIVQALVVKEKKNPAKANSLFYLSFVYNFSVYKYCFKTPGIQKPFLFKRKYHLTLCIANLLFKIGKYSNNFWRVLNDMLTYNIYWIKL